MMIDSGDSKMKHLVEYKLESGGSVFVEVDELEAGGIVRAARGEIAAKASQTFEDAIDAVKPAILSVVSKLKEMSMPGQIAVEFGIKLGAKAGAVFSSADAEATFKITLTWKGSGGEAHS
jgi:NTP-dependent ternary system trypsin peptidase co-occuring protein